MTDNTSFQEITTVPKTAASTVITVSSNSSSFSSVMASTRKRTTINADDNDDNDDNNDVGETVTVNISSKRPKVSAIVDHALAIDVDVDAAVDAAAVDDDTDAKTNVIVTPTMTTTTTDAITATAAKEEVETIVDIAESIRLKAGDRIEVQWEIHNDKDKDNSNNNNNNGKKEEEEIGVVVTAAATKDDGNTNEKNTTTTTNDDDDEKEKDDGNSNDDDETNNDNVVVTLHWWKATLLEHDGRTLDSVAIRNLLYDARPDLGFPEPSLEDVIFMGHDVLINSEDVVNDEGSDDPDALIAVSHRMPFRRCGDINNEGEGEGYVARVRGENEIIFTNDDELEDILHTVLMGNFQKHQDKWKHLSAAQHAIIASTMKKKKDKLFTLIKEEVKHNKVITADSVKEMLTKM